jgi:putative ABC transport system permease protein
MSTIGRKIWRDLWHNKLRTFLVMLSIAVGVFALGLVFGASGTMRERMTESHQASVPPHMIFYTSLFNQDLVEAMRRAPGIVDAEGEITTDFRWKLEDEKDWRKGSLIARDDYEAQHMYRIDLVDGDWPAKRTLAVERMSSQHFNLPLGTPILVKVGRRERRLPIAGVVRHPYTEPPQIGLGNATFCATPKTVAWLTGQEQGFNTLNLRLEFAREDADKAARRIERRLERADLLVWFYEITDVKIHWAQETMDTVFLILAVLGMLSLGLSGFLIVNIMNATITQQTWQIGVMKVIGATFGHLVRIYLTMVLIYGGLALLLAMPLGIVSAHLLAGKLLDIFNILIGDFGIVPKAVGIQILVSLAVPVLAALVPVINGVRITPHQAICTHGLGGEFGRGWLDRLLGQIRHLPRPLALSLRNTFRRKARVSLTLLALVLGSVMFVMVLSVSASFDNTVDVLLRNFGHDVVVVLDRPRRITRLIEIAEGVPGVTRAEVWENLGAELKLANGEELDVGLWGIPSDSEIFGPRIASGRGLLPDDGRTILLNKRIATDEGFQVGDKVELTIAGQEANWTFVGLTLTIGDERENFVPFDALAREVDTVNRGTTVMVKSEKHDAETQKRLIEDLRAAYAFRRIKTEFLMGAEEMRTQNKAEFRPIFYLMLVMAILAAVVGSVGLMSTMSINVVERAREIGMMRAIGATSPTVVSIFVVEGVLIGVLSWLLSLPLSYPGALAFSRAIGMKLMNIELDFRYSVAGAALWLLIVAVLSMLASLWPALQATKVSVREALAYE